MRDTPEPTAEPTAEPTPPADALSADERAQFEAFKQAEADRQATLEAEKQAITDAELADFRKFKAEADAKTQAAADAKTQAEADAKAAEEAKARQEREDKALCPACQAPRNNPSRAGNPAQEYLPYCWACGFGSVKNRDASGRPVQPYPVLADEAAA